MSSRRTLVVLGGGGALGAYQVGGLVALAEAGHTPDALFGCSAGALNAAFLASEPTLARARQLADWWSDSASRRVLSPSRWSQVRGVASAVAARADALMDERPLRALVSTHVGAHDLSELAVPLTVTTTGTCSALPAPGPTAACGLGETEAVWDAPVESRRGALDVVLRSFSVARAVANRATVAPLLADPRVRVAPHVADAWAAGLLSHVPAGPRDFRHTAHLVAAGHAATSRWLAGVDVAA